MAFPSVNSVNPTSDSATGGAATSGSTIATSHSVVMPATVDEGDLLMVFGRCSDGGVAVSVTGGGWTIIQDQSDGSDDVAFWMYRDALADGSEAGTSITVEHDNARLSATSYAISGAEDPAVQPPESSTVATGSSTTPDPTTCTPTGGAKDYLWFWFGSWEGEQTLSKTAATNYADRADVSTGTAGAITNNNQHKTGDRQLNAASEDPGSVTISATDDWTAWAVVVHPAAPPPPVPTVAPTPPPHHLFRVPGGPRMFRVLQPPQGEEFTQDVDIIAPAALISSPGATPVPEVRVEPSPALVFYTPAAPLVLLESLFIDLKTQQFLMFGPAGLRKMTFAIEPFAPTEAPDDATVVSPAAIINAPGANPVPEVRVLPSAALALYTPGAPTPLVTVLPGAAAILAPGATPVPEVRVEPAAGLIAASATGTPAVTVEAGAATMLYTPGAPTPEVRVEPGAATVLYFASGIGTGEKEPTFYDLRARQFLLLAPGFRFKMLPQKTRALLGDTTVQPPAATFAARADAPVPEVRVEPGASTILFSLGAPTPEGRVEPSAGIIVASATGTPAVTVRPGAATMLYTLGAPVPEVRVEPGAATSLAIAR